VGKSGRIKGNICGKVISIEGEVRGNLVGEERIVLRQSGKVRGDMRAPRINLEEGAKFKGDIDTDSESGGESGEKQTLKEVKVISSKASSPQKEAPKKADATDASKPNGSGSASELVSREASIDTKV